MATVTAFIREPKKDLAKIRFRLRDGRDLQVFYVSDILIEPELWDNKKQEIKSRILVSKDKRNTINNKVAEIKRLILDIYSESKIALTSESLTKLINLKLYPYLQEQDESKLLNAIFLEFIEQRTPHLSEKRIQKYQSILKIIQRFQKFYNLNLSIKDVTIDTLHSFERYLRDEHNVYKVRPELFEGDRELRIKYPRGKNTIIDRMQALSTFFNWCVTNQLITSSPFVQYKGDKEVYGTPYYISIEERNKIYQTNLSRHPFLAKQRDIFVFQCMIGCRISDLYSLTKKNIVDNCIIYIPNKTKEKTPKTVKVPLNSIAQEILKRYKSNNTGAILPFASQYRYNLAIKQIFLAARLTRPVIVIDPVTREQIIKPLNEVASSHMARRTFVGNLYKKVQDPSLISSLSGHEEGSRAFLRYRNIDDEIKANLVKLLEK